MPAPDIKILYFDHRIRAEPSRLLLAYGNFLVVDVTSSSKGNNWISKLNVVFG